MSGLTDEQIAYVSGKIDLPLFLVAIALIAFVFFLSFRQARNQQARPMTEEERRATYDTSRVVEPRRRNTMDLGKPE